MPSRNQFPGYIKLPGQECYESEIRFDFNGRIEDTPESTKLDGFSIRMFAANIRLGDDRPEIGITLTSEQLLDLIDSLKDEYEMTHSIRRKFDEDR